EPNQPLDPSKDRRLGQVIYAVMPSPVDSSVWGTVRASPGSIVRIVPGTNPPETTLTEVYNVPLPRFGPRGGDIDRQGDVRVATANLREGVVARKDGKMSLLRVPYPLGFYAKGLDGRIDEPNAGWKGRGFWTAGGDRAPWLIEGGKGMKPMAVHFQLRPD